MGFFSSPGLDAVKSATNTASQLTDSYKNMQNGYRLAGDQTAGKLFGLPGNGGLNPYLSQQFAREKQQIGRAYGDAVGAAQKGLTQRGMGVAPSGMSASLINTANRNAGETETNAYGDQLNRQIGLGLEGVRYNQAQQDRYSPLNPLQLKMKGGELESQLGGGSTFSNIMKGVGTVATAMA